MLAPVFGRSEKEIPLFKTVALEKKGIDDLYSKISAYNPGLNISRKTELIFEKAWSIIQNSKMKDIDREELKKDLSAAITKDDFNLYAFAENYS
jgi:putative protein kinase ArgK-like GTPase of G3E family